MPFFNIPGLPVSSDLVSKRQQINSEPNTSRYNAGIHIDASDIFSDLKAALGEEMVINTHYKFIFVHVPKTAGTSVMKSLVNVRGNNKNWLAKTKHETLAELYSNAEGRYSLKDKLLFRTLNNYFTFGLIRNPWDRMASFYRFLVEKRPIKEINCVSSFRDFLIQAIDGVKWIQDLNSMKPQLDYFTFPDGMMKMDFLGHFEFLEEDLNSVATRIGCPMILPCYNRSSNTGRDYRDEYDEEMIKIVQSLFEEEIAHFGYIFDDKYPVKRCSERLNSRR